MLDRSIPAPNHLWIASRVVHHFSPWINLTERSLSVYHTLSHAFFAPTEKKTKGADKEDGFDLFENKVERKKVSYYRLNAKSRVTGTQDLLKWYQRIRADSVRPSKETFVAGYTIEALQDLKEQLTGRYSKKYIQRHSYGSSPLIGERACCSGSG